MRVYRCLITVLTPFLVGALLLRVLRKTETWADLGQRLGLRSVPCGDAQGQVIWVHGASLGEIKPLRPILEALLAQRPDVHIILSSNSLSARDMVKGWNSPRITARLAPLDLRWIYRRSFKALNLRAFVLIEGDYWPNRLHCAKQSAARCIALGARMSQSSHKLWSVFARDAAAMLRNFDVIMPLDDDSADRLCALGARSIGPELSLKAHVATQPAEGTTEERSPAAPALTETDPRQVWLAASTHEGEEEILLRAHCLARQNQPDLKMILAPRHPHRGAEIRELAQGLALTCAQRSTGAPFDLSCDVYIADTLNEMPLWYRRANVTFVAGSLTPKGGHTPFEPLAFGSAIVHGPHVENFAEIYRSLDAAQGAMLAKDAQDIAAAILDLQDPARHANLIAQAQSALPRTDATSQVLEYLMGSLS